LKQKSRRASYPAASSGISSGDSRQAAGLGLADFSELGFADDESLLLDDELGAALAAPLPPLSLDVAELAGAAPSAESVLVVLALLA
jgi:hypothetical protein